MKGLIYKITNKVNNKSYIGQTRYTLEFRWRQHLNSKDNCYFHKAIKKYGAENFNVEILEECDFKDLDSREIFYIAKYNTFKDGYNSTIGGDGVRTLMLDDKYDEIKRLYLSGFSSNKIATLYDVDKASVVKILKSLDVKIRNNKISINKQEFEELVRDYKTGYSLKQLAKRYDCSSVGLKEYLLKKGVDIREKYQILEDPESQEKMIYEYQNHLTKVDDLLKKYHCSYLTFKKILSLHKLDLKGVHKEHKLNEEQNKQVISLYLEGLKVDEISQLFKVDRCTIYSVLKRHDVKLRRI